MPHLDLEPQFTVKDDVAALVGLPKSCAETAEAGSVGFV